MGGVHVLQMGLGWLSGPSVLGRFVTGSLSPHPHPAPLRPRASQGGAGCYSCGFQNSVNTRAKHHKSSRTLERQNQHPRPNGPRKIQSLELPQRPLVGSSGRLCRHPGEQAGRGREKAWGAGKHGREVTCAPASGRSLPGRERDVQFIQSVLKHRQLFVEF